MRNIWRRVSQLVARSRGGNQQLHLALERLSDDTSVVTADQPLSDRQTDDVLRLLRGNGEGTVSGFGPVRIEGFGVVGDTFTRPLSGDSSTSGDCTHHDAS